MVAPAAQYGSKEQIRILISDQDVGARRGLVSALETGPWELYEAASGGEALAIVRSELVHVLVSAVELPDTTGFDVVHGVRQLRHRRVPFILTASQLSKELLLRALVAEAFTVIQKPIDAAVFRSTVEHLVGRWYRFDRTRRSDDLDRWLLGPREDELL